MERIHLASVTRISDFARAPYDTFPLPRARWETGDYVTCRVITVEGLRKIELADGTNIEANEGDLVVGALGSRFATLEATGDWREVTSDLSMEALTSAGLFGKATSKSSALPPLLGLRYVGHVARAGHKVRMEDFVAEPSATELTSPIILFIGSSMSAGKTTAARTVIRRLKAKGFRVAGTKVTGAGRYQDILGMQRAGADGIVDFVDAGLPSTICSVHTYRRALKQMVSQIQAHHPDVVVAEAGASPLEPYNGDTAIELLGHNVVLTILCTSDPYAVVGVTTAYHRKADLVTGIVASTAAGVALVERLTGMRVLNLLDERDLPELDALLDEALATFPRRSEEAKVDA